MSSTPHLRNLSLSLFALLCILPSLAIAQPGPTQQVSWSATVEKHIALEGGGERIEMTGVSGRQGDISIKADRAVYNSRTQQAELRGNVRVSQPGTSLIAPSIDYNGASGVAITRAGSTIQDGSATIVAGYAEYYTNRRSALFRNGVTMQDGSTRLEAGSGTYSSVSRIGDFEGNVTVTNDSGTLRSNKLNFNRANDAAFAQGDVRLFSKTDSTLLESDVLRRTPNVETRAIGNVRLTSYRDSTLLTTDTLIDYPGRETEALGNVVLVSQPDRATLTGTTLRHNNAAARTVITGSPMLVQTDSTLRLYKPGTPGDTDSTERDDGDTTDETGGTDVADLELIRRNDSTFIVERDTTRILADTLERITLDEKIFVARGNARLGRGDLVAVADIATLYEDREMVTLSSRVAEAGKTDSTEVADNGGTTDEPVDSLDAFDPNDTTKVAGDGPPPPSHPVVWFESTQLTGDSIAVVLIEQEVRTIDVVGDGMMIDETEGPDRYNQMAGERILFGVLDRQLESIDVEGSAASMFFLFDRGIPDGVDRSSADNFAIRFEGGEVTTFRSTGTRSRPEGELLPEKDVAGNESRFRLDGFLLYDRPAIGALAITDTIKETVDDDASGSLIVE